MKRRWLYFFLLFVIILVAGILFGDAQETFNKAIKICLECIGIG